MKSGKSIHAILRFVIITLTVFSVSCSGVKIGNNITTGTTTEAISVDEVVEMGGNSASSNSSSGDESPTLPSETELATPVAEIPSLPSSLVKEFVIAYSPDQQGNIPVIGFEGAVEYKAGYKIAVSTTAIEPVVSCNEPTIIEKAKDLVVPQAYAQSEAQSVCESDGVECCDVQSNGSYECFLSLVNESVSEVYVAVVDESGNVGTPVKDAIQKNLLYVGNTPDDIKDVNGELYSIADDNGVVARDDGSGMRVTGDYNLGYKTFDADGTALAYADTDSLVGVMGDNGVQLLDYNAGTVIDTGEKAIDPNAKAYTFLRALNGVLYYGIEQESASKGVLNYAVTGEKWWPSRHKPIIITDGDTDTQGNEIRHTRTLGFGGVTVGTHNWRIVVFEDDTNIRIRAIEDTGHMPAWRLGGEIWKSASTVNVRDIASYHGDSETGEVNFAILDNKDSKVWLGDFDTNANNGTIEDSKAVAVGKNPQSMVFSSKSGNLYVLNKDDQNISVIPLMSDAKTVIAKPVVTKTIKLADAVPGKTIDFKASAIILKDDKLIVTDETTKSLILIDNADNETVLPLTAGIIFGAGMPFKETLLTSMLAILRDHRQKKSRLSKNKKAVKKNKQISFLERLVRMAEVVKDKSGRKKVLLDYKEWQKLVEDYEDLMAVLKTKDEPRVTWESVKKGLKKDGLL
ncbi:MAG: hypothetical protein HQM16_10960 [Deltaproteobacteria bacterium]|nr:hypothetical protein [Deltaproteobacteria bacterium]